MPYVRNSELGIPRPPSAYALFLKDIAKKAHHGTPKRRLRSKTLWYQNVSAKWHHLSNDEKKHYKNQVTLACSANRKYRSTLLNDNDSDDKAPLECKIQDGSQDICRHEFVSSEGTFEFQKVLGKGAYGTVSQFRDKWTGLNLAGKIAHTEDSDVPSTLEDLDNERRILTSLDNCWIVRCYGYAVSTTGKVALMIEMAESCLKSWLHLNPIWPERQGPQCRVSQNVQLHRWQLLMQILQGLDYLHKQNMLHCDLKPGNALIFASGSMVKLADLGCSRVLSDKSYKTKEFGRRVFTLQYRAPEFLMNPNMSVEFGFEADVYAYACMAFDVLAKEQILFKDADVMCEMIEAQKSSDELKLWRTHRDARLRRAILLPLGQEFVTMGIESRLKRQSLPLMATFVKGRIAQLAAK